jgi:enterochelin esterase-like enzyme
MILARCFILLTAVTAATACAPRRELAPVATATDSVAFVPLRSGLQIRDCDARPAALCRVTRFASTAELRAHLANGEAVWQTGNELTFAWQGNATGVSLEGGIQLPLSPVVGTDLWVLTVRAENLDSAIVSYAMLPSMATLPIGFRLQFATWRGRNAPPAPLRPKALAGRVIHDTLNSTALRMRRPVSVYVPPARGGQPVAAVVYMGDGQGVAGFAATIDTLISAGRLPRVMIVGSHTVYAAPDLPPGTDIRSLEYIGTGGGERFVAHERYVLDELMPYAESRHGAPAERSRRAFFGVSNGGGLALSMLTRHPDTFGFAFPFSAGGSFDPTQWGDVSGSRVYLMTGQYEGAFRARTRERLDALRSRGATVEFREPAAAHDSSAWDVFFPRAVVWAFGGK